MGISRWLLLQRVKPPSSVMVYCCCIRVCSPFLWAESASWMGWLARTLPPVNPPVCNCPAPQLSSPFQHNNSIAAPGASCHPELSFVLLLSLLDWMLALCDFSVFPSTFPVIIFPELNEKDAFMDTKFGPCHCYKFSSSPLTNNKIYLM